MIDALKVHMAPTLDGNGVYLQVTGRDGLSVNVVLVAEKVILDDNRLTSQKDEDIGHEPETGVGQG
jgi:hypothetical protein